MAGVVPECSSPGCDHESPANSGLFATSREISVCARLRGGGRSRSRTGLISQIPPNLIKIVFWDGTGLCLFTKRLEQGVFLWPSNVEPGGTLALNSEQLSMLIEGVDWRAPERRWRPAVAG